MTTKVTASQTNRAPAADEAVRSDLAALVTSGLGHEGLGQSVSLLISDSEGQRALPLPMDVRRALSEVIEALSHGKSAIVVPGDSEISTQQAADIIGVSRPTVVALINRGELAAHVPGSIRRRVRLPDVLAYRDELYQKRTRFIAESSDEYPSVENVSELISEARNHA